MNPSVVVDEKEAGLPLPPLDDLSCLIAYDTSIGFYNVCVVERHLSYKLKQCIFDFVIVS